MPLFRRRQHPISPAAPSPGSGTMVAPLAASRDEPDWRSFDSVAETYGRVLAPHFGLVAADLVQLLQVGPGQRVLDVGTGTGVGARAAFQAARAPASVVGIDPAIEMLRVARRERGGPHYAAAVAIDLPFRDATFDHLMANFSMAYFPRYDTALFDLLRVLKPGGRLAVSAWGPGDDRDDLRESWRAVAEEFAEREILDDAVGRAIPWEEKLSDRAALKEVLHDAGLRDIWTEPRRYRFEMSREDWLTGREATPLGRFLHQMLGPELWGAFGRRAREVFADRFPDPLNDFRDVVVAVGHKP